MILLRHNELPSAIALFGHTPERDLFSWRNFNPRQVKSPNDLPRYLIFGGLKPVDFEQTGSGWTARWRGNSASFSMTYLHASDNYSFTQSWRGISGGEVTVPAKIPADQAIAAAFQSFYAEPPTVWDRAARKTLEDNFQINIVDQPKGVQEVVELPDGISRTLAFPIAVFNLRPMWRWLKEQVRQDCPYPVLAEARLVFQAINFVEGKTPSWTGRPVSLAKQSHVEMGLPPLAEPIREVADTTAAWTLRRLVYFMLVKVPFSGLTDFLERVESENGPIRSTQAPPLRFDMRPLVFSSGLEQRARNLVIWDAHKTMRSFIQWALPGRGKPASMAENAAKSREQNPAALLQLVEEIGAKMSEKPRGF
ncbi:MAG: hypothetical protein LBG61_06145 [Burkholderiales bacterium]|jgi:hypothetical protein|nr:hypothetical protein [Burkholderiales bacterium]